MNTLLLVLKTVALCCLVGGALAWFIYDLRDGS